MDMHLKILLGSSLYPPNVIGGSEMVVNSLAKELTEDGHEIVVVTTQPNAEGPRQEVIDGVTVHYLPVKNLYRPFGNFEPEPIRKSLWRAIDSYNVFMMPSLKRVIQLEMPDVVNTHNLTGLSVAMWSVAERLGVPVVHTLHDQYLLCHRSTMFKSGKNCTRKCVDCRILSAPRKMASQKISGAIGVSRFILERHKQLGYFKSAATAIIYNAGRDFRTDGGIPADRTENFRFGFLGQIIPTKGVKELVDAFMEAGVPEAELLIAGKGDSPYAAELRHATAAVANIHWLGFVNRGDFFRGIDLLVVPSTWHDTAPLVVLEALSQGIPVLGSNLGGIPELISADTGWLFDPSAEGSLRDSLRQCFESRSALAEMSRACLTRAIAFRKTKWSTQYVNSFQAAISSHTAAARASRRSP
jgi:glycosyltransferase involved in cell wall biosynthesis